MPDITGIRYDPPGTTHFTYDKNNIFYILGSGLKGETLRRMEGKSSHGGSSKGVKWKKFKVLDNTSATQLKVEGTPENPHGKGPPRTDPGDVTPTLDGSGFSKAVTASYGP